MNQCVARLEQDARQPRLAMEADGPAHTNTEGAAKAVQVNHGDSCTARRIQDRPKTSINFGVKAEPPALPCRDDVVVANGAAAPKSCLLPLEMRTTSAASRLLFTGKTSTATTATFKQQPRRPSSTEETCSREKKLWTSTSTAWYNSNFRRNNLLASSSSRRVNETKYGQNIMFDPCDSQDHLRACPFLETWRALRCGEAIRVGAASDDLQRFWRIDVSRFKNMQENETNRLRRKYCGRSVCLRYGSIKKTSCRRGRLEVIGCQG